MDEGTRTPTTLAMPQSHLEGSLHRKPYLVISLVWHSQMQSVQHLIHFISFHFGFNSMSQKPVTSLRKYKHEAESQGILQKPPVTPSWRDPELGYVPEVWNLTRTFAQQCLLVAKRPGAPQGPVSPLGQTQPSRREAISFELSSTGRTCRAARAPPRPLLAPSPSSDQRSLERPPWLGSRPTSGPGSN